MTLLETSSMMSKVPLLCALIKVIIMPVTLYCGKRGIMMIIASFISCFGFWTLYNSDPESYYGLVIPIFLFPFAASINDFIPLNSMSLLSNKKEVGIY